MNSKNLPPLGPIVSFCAAAKHQSFTKAAQELDVTHGAISRAVKQLEEYFGAALFDRRNRRLYLTDKGRLFSQLATSLLTELEIGSEQIRAQQTTEKLAVSCEPSLAMRWLMPRLGDFYQHNNEIDIHLSTAGGPVDLAAQNIDLAIRRSDFKWPADYWVTQLGSESIGPVCHPDYWQKIKDKPAMLLHTRTRPSAWKDWQSLSGKHIEGEIEQYFDHFYFSLQAAVAGLGIAIGPKVLVCDDIAKGHLIAPFGFYETPINYVMLSLKNPNRHKQLNDFYVWLQSEFNKPLLK